MTDIQVESTQTKKHNQKPKPKSTEIKYDEKAVAEGKLLVKALQSNEMKLGELADRLQPRYGDKTLARFAKEIGLPVATLNRCRSVYRAWKGIEEPAPNNFGVKQALQGHPLRAEIVKNNPNLTRREARTFMQDYKKAHGQDEDWEVIESRRWWAQREQDALVLVKNGRPAQKHLDPAILRQALDNPDQLLATLRAGGNASLALADMVEQALAPPTPPPPPMFDAGGGKTADLSDSTESGDPSSEQA
jgi:hypothetical protein